MEYLSPPSMEGLDALLSVSASTVPSYFLIVNYKPGNVWFTFCLQVAEDQWFVDEKD